MCRTPEIRGQMDVSPSSLQPALTLSFSILKSLLGSNSFVAPPQASRGVEGFHSTMEESGSEGRWLVHSSHPHPPVASDRVGES